MESSALAWGLQRKGELLCVVEGEELGPACVSEGFRKVEEEPGGGGRMFCKMRPFLSCPEKMHRENA